MLNVALLLKSCGSSGFFYFHFSVVFSSKCWIFCFKSTYCSLSRKLICGRKEKKSAITSGDSNWGSYVRTHGGKYREEEMQRSWVYQRLDVSGHVTALALVKWKSVDSAAAGQRGRHHPSTNVARSNHITKVRSLHCQTMVFIIADINQAGQEIHVRHQTCLIHFHRIFVIWSAAMWWWEHQ